MTDREKGDIIARNVWSWVLNQRSVEVVPWLTSPLSSQADHNAALRRQGYQECLADLRMLIISKSEELNQIAKKENFGEKK